MTEQDYIRSVKGYEGLYTVDALGNIFSLKRNKKLIPCEDKFGYMKVCLSNKGKEKQKKIHRIVAEAFIPNPLNKPQVNHIDGNKKNNCVWNLEWCTNSENMHHMYECGKGNGMQVKIVETGEVFNTVLQCAKHINGDDSNILQCLKGKRKTHKGYHFERIGEQA